MRPAAAAAASRRRPDGGGGGRSWALAPSARLRLCVAVLVATAVGCGGDLGAAGPEPSALGSCASPVMSDLPAPGPTGQGAAGLGAQALAAENAGAVRRYGAEQAPDAYAGIHYRPETGTSQVGFTKNAEEHAAELLRIVPHPDRLGFFRATNTFRELGETQQALVRDRELLRAEGIEVVGSELREDANVVVVLVDNPTPEERDQLCQRYGTQRIRVEEAGPPARPA